LYNGILWILRSGALAGLAGTFSTVSNLSLNGSLLGYRTFIVLPRALNVIQKINSASFTPVISEFCSDASYEIASNI